MKKRFVILFSFLLILFSGCQSQKQDDNVTSTTPESTTIINENTTTENDSSVNIGETINLELNKEYVFGIDLPTGTYQLEINSSPGQYGSFAFNNSANNCNIGNVDKNGEGGQKLFDPQSFGYGATIVVGGNFDSAELHYISNEISPDEADACEM